MQKESSFYPARVSRITFMNHVLDGFLKDIH